MGNNDDHVPQNSDPQPATDELSLTLIEEQAERSIRRVWHDGRWFFSVIDVIAVLTESTAPRKYWFAMRKRITDEGFRELLSKCQELKLPTSDGRFRETDCADFATMVSLIHAVPALRRRADRNDLTENAISSPSPCGISGIYAVINTRTSEQYIGSSGNILERFAQHKALLRRGKHHALRLQEAWNTYGEAAFAFVVLEELPTREQLEIREQQYLDAEQPAYNEATVANNAAALLPISDERIQQLILSLYDIQRSTTPMPLFEALRDALVYGLVKPGPHFHLLVQAEASGVASWEALRSFLRQQRNSTKHTEEDSMLVATATSPTTAGRR